MKESRQSYYGMNFLLNALCGHRGTDAFYDQHKADIEIFLADLRQHLPTNYEIVFRGILLDPEIQKTNGLKALPHLRYISFSSDPAVALEFADLNSEMSAAMKQYRPKYQGYFIKHLATPDSIIFHHSWAERLGLERYLQDGIETVRRQKEVMIRNDGQVFKLNPVPRGCSSVLIGTDTVRMYE